MSRQTLVKVRPISGRLGHVSESLLCRLWGITKADERDSIESKLNNPRRVSSEPDDRGVSEFVEYALPFTFAVAVKCLGAQFKVVHLPRRTPALYLAGHSWKLYIATLRPDDVPYDDSEPLVYKVSSYRQIIGPLLTEIDSFLCGCFLVSTTMELPLPGFFASPEEISPIEFLTADVRDLRHPL